MANVELSFGWNKQIVNARNKPTTFVVVDKHENIFSSCTDCFQDYFYKKCPFESRLIKELTILKEKPGMVEWEKIIMDLILLL